MSSRNGKTLSKPIFPAPIPADPPRHDAVVQPGHSVISLERHVPVLGDLLSRRLHLPYLVGAARKDLRLVSVPIPPIAEPGKRHPLRLMIPGFEGIFHTKWLRRIKVVDRYYMNYNDYGHLDRDPKIAALEYQIGPKSVITFPSGGHQLAGRGFYEISGLAWSGGGAIRSVEVSTDGGRKWNRAEFKGTPQRFAHTRFGYAWNWDGNETEILSRCTDEIGQVQPTREQVAKYWNEPFDRNYRVPGLDNSVQPWRIAKDGSVTNGLACSSPRCSKSAA